MLNSNNNIAVFPASGALGNSTISHLLKLLPKDAAKLILVSRYPEKAQTKADDRYAIVRKGDYDDETSLENVFKGASTLFLVSYPSLEYEHRFEVHKKAIDAARKSGIKHVFYTSLAFGFDCKWDTTVHIMKAHIDTEKYLNQLSNGDKSFTYTAIREGIYTESFPLYTSFFDLQNPTTEIKLPIDGKHSVAFAKRDELGEATARLIINHTNNNIKKYDYINKIILLSGPQSISFNEMARIFSKLLNKSIQIKTTTVNDYCNQEKVKALTVYGGGTDNSTQIWSSTYNGIENGESSITTNHLSSILERQPESFETTISNLLQN